MRPTATIAASLLAIALAGCGEATPDAPPSDTMAMESGVQAAEGTGTVTAVDVEKGTVTLDHAPMPQIGWSAMTMTFAADPSLLAGVKEGDEVIFDVTLTDGRSEITALRKAGGPG